MGGTYHSQESGYSLHNLFVGDSDADSNLTSAKLYGVDSAEDSTLLSFPLDLDATKNPYVERVGIDLNEISPLSGYKVISKMVPQVHTDNSNREFNFSFGAADLINTSPVYENVSTFDAAISHKIDARSSGRYLSYKMTVSDQKDFKFLGFDVEITVTGRR